MSGENDLHLQTFIDLAASGRAASAEDDEHAAYRMAMTAIEDSPLLSDEALMGFAMFAAVAHHNPGEMLRLIESDV